MKDKMFYNHENLERKNLATIRRIYRDTSAQTAPADSPSSEEG
jgi:hypothetical protein